MFEFVYTSLCGRSMSYIIGPVAMRYIRPPESLDFRTQPPRNSLMEDDGHNVKHLILQCPTFQQEQTDLFNEIRSLSRNISANLLDNEQDVLSILLGKYVENYTEEQMEGIWIVAGRHIDLMYRKKVSG